MPNRSYTAGNQFRYGFNGKEKSNEIYGEGNAYDFGARIQDSRLGRWFSVDKVIKPSFSSYQFAKGNPINFIDPDGNDEIHFYYYTQDNLDGNGRAFTTITISTKIIQNGDRNHTFFVHNKNLGSFDGSGVQIKPFINGTNLPNQSSFSAAEKGLPLAPVTEYLFGFAKNYTDDYEYLGRLLQVDPTVLQHYKDDHQWSWAFNGATAQASTAKFAKSLVGKSELVFAIIDGYYGLRGLFSLVRSLKSGVRFTVIEGGSTYAEYEGRALGSYSHSAESGLELDLNIPKDLQSKGFGTQIFSDAVQATRANKFTATWVQSAGYEGGASANLKQFWEARKAGKSEVDAAWSTWSGQQARNNGFTNVTVEYTNGGTGVKAVFTK